LVLASVVAPESTYPPVPGTPEASVDVALRTQMQHTPETNSLTTRRRDGLSGQRQSSDVTADNSTSCRRPRTNLKRCERGGGRKMTCLCNAKTKRVHHVNMRWASYALDEVHCHRLGPGLECVRLSADYVIKCVNHNLTSPRYLPTVLFYSIH